MSRRVLLMLMAATSAGLIIGTLLISKDSSYFPTMQRLFAIQISDEYSLRCDANVRDNTLEISKSLPEATQYLSQRDNNKPAFFFVETSCLGNVNARQACAVESAAKLHPNYDVYLLLLTPPSSFNITRNPSLLTLQKHYNNVHILYLRLQNYFHDSILEEWYNSGILKTSQYLQSHTSDVFRFFTLWKYGGTYLDLDIVLTRSQNGLKNFAGAESFEDIAAGVLNFEPAKSFLSVQCVREIRDNFRGDDWGSNGPGVITRVLQKLCHTKDTNLMTRNKCAGFTVLPPNAFYPIPWKEWRLYFDENLSDFTMKTLSHSYGIHVWNKFSSTEKIIKGSKQPYGLVAHKFCPYVYQNSGTVF